MSSPGPESSPSGTAIAEESDALSGGGGTVAEGAYPHAGTAPGPLHLPSLSLDEISLQAVQASDATPSSTPPGELSAIQVGLANANPSSAGGSAVTQGTQRSRASCSSDGSSESYHSASGARSTASSDTSRWSQQSSAGGSVAARRCSSGAASTAATICSFPLSCVSDEDSERFESPRSPSPLPRWLARTSDDASLQAVVRHKSPLCGGDFMSADSITNSKQAHDALFQGGSFDVSAQVLHADVDGLHGAAATENDGTCSAGRINSITKKPLRLLTPVSSSAELSSAQAMANLSVAADGAKAARLELDNISEAPERPLSQRSAMMKQSYPLQDSNASAVSTVLDSSLRHGSAVLNATPKLSGANALFTNPKAGLLPASLKLKQLTHSAKSAQQQVLSTSSVATDKDGRPATRDRDSHPATALDLVHVPIIDVSGAGAREVSPAAPTAGAAAAAAALLPATLKPKPVAVASNIISSSPSATTPTSKAISSRSSQRSGSTSPELRAKGSKPGAAAPLMPLNVAVGFNPSPNRSRASTTPPGNAIGGHVNCRSGSASPEHRPTTGPSSRADAAAQFSGSKAPGSLSQRLIWEAITAEEDGLSGAGSLLPGGCPRPGSAADEGSQMDLLVASPQVAIGTLFLKVWDFSLT